MQLGSGALPQAPGVPAPPQVVPLPCGQSPQSSEWPQLSPIFPQKRPPMASQVWATQPVMVPPQTCGVPSPPQVRPPVQSGQSSILPQTSRVTALQVSPAGQPPHSRALPQPSPILPQYLPPT